MDTTVDHLVDLPVLAPLPRGAVSLLDLVTTVPLVSRSARAPEVDVLFRSDALLGSVVVCDADGRPELLSRTRFEFHMAGRLGFGRAVYAQRTIESMLPDNTLVLDVTTDLAAATSAMLRRPEGRRYDDVVVIGADVPPDRAAVVTVQALLEALARQFAHRSLHDPLTGLPNRLLLARHCEAVLDAAAPAADPVLLYIDLDGFKLVNDQYGHAAGDAVLVEFARRLEALADGRGVPARLGGDEFALLLAGLNPRQAAAVAEQVVLAANSPFFHGDQVLSIGASVGLAVPDSGGVPALVEAAHTDSIEVLLRRADAAMYRAKQAGRNRVVLGDEPQARPGRSVLIARALADAVAAGAQGPLVLHYQPKLRLPDRSLVEVEALLRWRDPVLGAVSPAEFIPVAEAEGVIGPLSRLVLDTACRQAAAWDPAVVPRVAVNVSPLHLAEPDFCAQVFTALDRSGLPAQRLCIEITETAAVEDLALAVSRLDELRKAGITVALDDFGTGASSLALLRHLPVDVIKIDRQFVADVDVDPSDTVLVRLIVEAAHSMGKAVCAEGVERPGQVTQLVAVGCDSAQGFHLGMPVGPAEIDAAVPDAAGGDRRAERPLVTPGLELLAVVEYGGEISYSSAAVIDVLGYQPWEMVGTNVRDHLHADDWDLVTAGESPARPVRAQRADGSYVLLDVDARPLGGTRPIGASLLTVRDVTAQVRAEDRLRAVERQLAGLA